MPKQKAGRRDLMLTFRRKSTWELKPGQMLPGDIVAAEPRLAGLEDNAAYRILMAKGPGSFDLVWLFLFETCLIGYFVIWGHFVKERPWVDVLGFYFLYLISTFAYFFKQAQKSDLPDFLSNMNGFNRAFLDELSMAGFPHRDFLHGIWGYQIRRPLKIERYAVNRVGTMAMLLLIPYVLFEPDPWQIRIVVGMIHGSWLFGACYAYLKYLRHSDAWALGNFVYRGSDESWPGEIGSPTRIRNEIFAIIVIFILIGFSFQLTFMGFYPILQASWVWMLSIPYAVFASFCVIRTFRRSREKLDANKEAYYKRALEITESLFDEIHQQMTHDVKLGP